MTFFVRDSAGIRIVTSRAPLWGDETLRLAAEPELSIGAVSGAPEYLFSHIEGVARLSDGRVVVGDRPSQEVRYYSPEGRFLFRAGGEGEGPGELGWLRALRQCARDTIYAFEIDWRAEVFDASGRFVRQVTPRFPPSFAVRRPYELSCGGGRLVVNGWGAEVLDRERAGVYRTTSPVAVLAADGSVFADLGLFPGAERIRDPGDSPYPMGKALVHAVEEERVYVGTADRFEIEVWTLDGTPIARWRREVAPVPWDPARVEEWARRRAEEFGDAGEDYARTLRRRIDEYPQPESLPAYSRFVVDDLGRLWVREFSLPGAVERTWYLFRGDGVWLGALRVPAALEIMEMTAGRVVGRTRDELGVERAVVYRRLEP